MDGKGLLKRNFNRPPLKDTVTVPVGGYTIIRFYANNPGTWMFHCHLEFHTEIGMTLIFKIGNQADLPKVPEGWPKCGSYFSKSSELEPPYYEINNSGKLFINQIFVFFTILFFYSFLIF